MPKTQMYFPINVDTKRKIEHVANQFGIPASNIVSEIVTQAVNKPKLDIRIPFSPVHSTTNHEIEESAKKFAKGDYGKKHHLID